MSLLKIAQVTPAVVAPNATVLEAVECMAEHGVGGVAVVENDELVGIFTERDVMLRVVLRLCDPKTARVREVMTAPVETASEDMPEEDALVYMVERHVRHLPIVGSDGRLKSILSIRNVLEHRVDELAHELQSIDQYLSNDGPGG